MVSPFDRDSSRYEGDGLAWEAIGASSRDRAFSLSLEAAARYTRAVGRLAPGRLYSSSCVWNLFKILS